VTKRRGNSRNQAWRSRDRCVGLLGQLIGSGWETATIPAIISQGHRDADNADEEQSQTANPADNPKAATGADAAAMVGPMAKSKSSLSTVADTRSFRAHPAMPRGYRSLPAPGSTRPMAGDVGHCAFRAIHATGADLLPRDSIGPGLPGRLAPVVFDAP
jgi:hypothetical protein